MWGRRPNETGGGGDDKVLLREQSVEIGKIIGRLDKIINRHELISDRLIELLDERLKDKRAHPDA